MVRSALDTESESSPRPSINGHSFERSASTAGSTASVPRPSVDLSPHHLLHLSADGAAIQPHGRRLATSDSLMNRLRHQRASTVIIAGKALPPPPPHPPPPPIFYVLNLGISSNLQKRGGEKGGGGGGCIPPSSCKKHLSTGTGREIDIIFKRACITS